MTQINQIQKQTQKFLMLLDLLKKPYYNPKTTEIESKIPNISDLATNSALTADEDKNT